MAAAFFILQQHRLIRRERIFRDRMHPLDTYNDEEIKGRYRLNRDMIIELYELIHKHLEPHTKRNHAVPGLLQMFCALRYYACGSFQRVVGDGFGIHRSTVSRIVVRVTNAICRLTNRYISFPQRAQDFIRHKQAFHNIAGFPNVIGMQRYLLIYRRLVDEFVCRPTCTLMFNSMYVCVCALCINFFIFSLFFCFHMLFT